MKEYIVHAPKTKVMAVEEYTSFYGEPVEELIRCKDCRHYGNAQISNRVALTNFCFRYNDVRREEDFCSRAERKEE